MDSSVQMLSRDQYWERKEEQRTSLQLHGVKIFSSHWFNSKLLGLGQHRVQVRLMQFTIVPLKCMCLLMLQGHPEFKIKLNSPGLHSGTGNASQQQCGSIHIKEERHVPNWDKSCPAGLPHRKQGSIPQSSLCVPLLFCTLYTSGTRSGGRKHDSLNIT